MLLIVWPGGNPSLRFS